MAAVMFRLVLKLKPEFFIKKKLFIISTLFITGVVGQEPVLFRGTIFDNIAIGFPEATREEVQSVAEMAYAHDFITNLPNVSNSSLAYTTQYPYKLW